MGIPKGNERSCGLAVIPVRIMFTNGRRYLDVSVQINKDKCNVPGYMGMLGEGIGGFY